MPVIQQSRNTARLGYSTGSLPVEVVRCVEADNLLAIKKNLVYGMNIFIQFPKRKDFQWNDCSPVQIPPKMIGDAGTLQQQFQRSLRGEDLHGWVLLPGMYFAVSIGIDIGKLAYCNIRVILFQGLF